ncbi:hypothetical protein QBC46DRAFT_104566 [Diplogelasinospora grovesii]|uniref:Uncharacterized protein n=1 Tax=Diplogelasinospora grovesii TaxID=303347 RepID=A0AAN6S621_9PEZI|nr:hypothetical protein QBC46DRAFT_104566 [Diplogelasinospora grovesii]
MASPAVAVPQVNGVAALSRPDSPASSINSSTKRKRDSSDDRESEVNESQGAKPTVNGVHTSPSQKSLVRDFFDVLQSFDTSGPAILKLPLPDTFFDGEPSAKRAKSEENTKPTTITDKVMQDAYETLDGLVSDISQAVKSHVKELETAGPDADPRANDEAIAKAIAFKNKAFELCRRELAYPYVPRPSQQKTDLREALPPSATGGLVLTTFGAAPTLKPLFTSLQRATTPDGVLRPLADNTLPNGISTTRILPDAPAASEKSTRTLTLGELFPSPRNLPPLQPPKAPKNTTKSNVLTFYHPELTEKSKYRQGTYFSQNITTGHWLDYSNATPTTHAKTKQRERAQSLAGVKPSSTELEMSEMEALFRGAFSSFAPCKDDSAAIIPSSQVRGIWWQRVGRRNFERLVESEVPDEEAEDGAATDSAIGMEIDEELVKEAIDNWDESAIDPSLDEVMGKKSDYDKEVDDLLEEVSDLIETLASYQRNRNLTLPTSQDRYSADPVNGDMLRNGSLSHQPSEEEMMTYQALKAQLSMIIQTLPPYAVARLNSDKLAELSVSTKIEVRTDEYKGVMEEDEPARLARQAAQAAASTSQRQTHRAPSVSGASPYANHQYSGQFAPSARPIANAQHYPQTPVRPQAPNMYSQTGPPSLAIQRPHPSSQQRPVPATQYRPQNSYGYAPQLAKAQTPYGHANVPQYAATPGQPRMAPHPGGYSNVPLPQPGNANHRYPSGGGFPNAGFPQPQQMQPQPVQHLPVAQHSPHPAQLAQQPQHHAQQPGFPQYTNGAAPMPRTISPQVALAHPYSPSPTPPQQPQQIPRPAYGSPAQGIPANPVPVQRHPVMPGSAGGTPQSGAVGGTYSGVMPSVQQRQVMAQAQARADAEQRVSGHMGKVAQGEVVGLAGIGLGGSVDVHKIAAAKAMQMGNNMTPSPKLPIQQQAAPSPVNGTPMSVPPPVGSPLVPQQATPATQVAPVAPVANVGFKPSA